MRKTVYIGAICILVLLITFSATVVVGIRETYQRKNDVDLIEVIHHDVENIHSFAVEGERLNVDFKPVVCPLSDVPVADSEDDEVHPTLAKGSGQFFAGYIGVISILEQYVYLTTSSDGTSWTPQGHLEFEDMRPDYPDFDHWGGTSFKGTIFVDMPTNYLLEFDLSDLENIEAVYWDWLDNGWSDFRPLEISCHNSQNTWQYGMMCSVASTTYGRDQGWDGDDMPHIFFRDPDDESSGWISWQTFEGCEHSSCCIDKTMDIMWAAYDYYNETSGTWNIVVWGRDFADPLADGATKVFAEIISSYNAEYPTIAAYNNNIVIVCHSDENANSDLVCFYSNDGGENWDSTYITNSPDDEQYPDVVSNGDEVECTFTKNQNLFATLSIDSGETWSDPKQVNDEDGTVVSEWRCSELSTGGNIVWTDDRNGNKDIYYSSLAPFKPSTPDGPTSGKTGEPQSYSTSAVDPNGDDVSYGWDWDGDSVVDEWTGFNPSGTPVSTSHTWDADYTGEIKVKAKNSCGYISSWSDPLSVSIPRNKAVTQTLLQRFLEIYPNAFPLLRYILGL